MKITIWGCRGSLPIPGRSTLKYGGNTTCLEVRLSDGTLIIFDAGSGIKSLGDKIVKDYDDREIYLILTHSHWDHLMGFPFFVPAYLPEYTINVQGGPIAKKTLKDFLEHQMSPPYFPVSMNAMKANFTFTHGIPIVKQIGSATITPIMLNHPNGGYGFKVEDAGKSFVFLTDNELGYEQKSAKTMADYVQFCKGVDLLIHDGQYTPKEYEKREGWGHSPFTKAIDLALNAKVHSLGIFHHDPDHNDEELDRIGSVARQIILKKEKKLDCCLCFEGQIVIL